MKFKEFILEMSGKPYMTLQNMVAIVRRPEEVKNTLDIINKAEKKKLIRPLEAQRLKKELEDIKKGMMK